MKKATTCLVLLIFSITTFCQPTTPSRTLTKQEYLLKSKRQGKTALILAGGGVVLIVTGALLYQSGNSSIIFMGLGVLTGIASIPFFISSAINKGKSKKASLSFKFEKNPNYYITGTGSHSYLALSLKLRVKT